jgi:D-alanyl-lipoteichoic acid acyltransferase DltB (MBOAT superfamily)
LLLSSPTYFLFLGGIFFLYWPLARIRALTLALILFANYFFYARWDLTLLALIPVLSSVDYAIGLGLQRSKSPGPRRLLVASSIVMNVGALAFFKYMPFLLGSWANWTGKQAPQWHWGLPISLSFYCFQALTYTIDLYRRDTKGTRSYLAHLAAVSFFPTTLAGPITRMESLLTQFEKPKKLDPAFGGGALFLIGLGLIKKLLIADYLAGNLVNRVFDFPNLYSGMEVLVAVYAYAFELYYDFSGYTDIAIGSALLLGIKLPANFNRPYAAINVADFWRRWHITFSNWLRDYLYFSFPGKRTRIMPYLSLILTMVIGGLWHGPSWNFVVWGAIHGVGLAFVRLWQTMRGKRLPLPPVQARIRSTLAIFITFQFVAFAWIYFRAPDFQTASAIFGRIGSRTWALGNVSPGLWLVLAIGFLFHYLPKNWYEFSLNLYTRAPFYAQAAALVALAFGLQYVAQTGAAPFIYTKF